MAATVDDGGQEFHVMHLEPRPFRPFKTSEEYLYAMKEDLAEWLNTLYGVDITVDDFLERLETGVMLCQHANNVLRMARDWRDSGRNGLNIPIPDKDVVFRTDVQAGTFHARDNVANFINWCRGLSIKECLLFETEDLVMRKNERSFILCLLEVARRGSKFGMPAPLLVQMEEEIEAELAKDSGGSESDGHDADDDSDTLSEPPQQIITNDLRTLHERVVDLLNRCTCPSQFPMIRVADGKYRIGDTKVLIFVRILRSHVMVRVGGGWDTLEHYLDKHDPCRCRSGHRFSTSAKLTMTPGKAGSPHMQVTYNRPPSGSFSPGQYDNTTASPQVRRRSTGGIVSGHGRSRSISSTTGFPPAESRDIPPREPSRSSQYSDDSSASSLGGGSTRALSPAPDGLATATATRRASQSSTSAGKSGYPYINVSSADSSSENEAGGKAGAGHGSAGSGRQSRKCSPRKIMKTGDDVDQTPSSWKFSTVEPRSLTRQSSESSSVMSTEECTKPSDDAAANDESKLNGNCCDEAGRSSSNWKTSQTLLETDPSPKLSSSEKTVPSESVSATAKSSSANKTPFKSKIPCLDNPAKRLLRGQKAQSTEDLSSTKMWCLGSAQHSSALNGSPTRSPQKVRRSSAENSSLYSYSAGIPRSRSHYDGGDDPFTICRGGPGRYSCRSPRRPSEHGKRDTTSANKTWTFRQRAQRASLGSDTFRPPSSSATSSPAKSLPQKHKSRSTGSSPLSTPARSPLKQLTSPNKPLSPLLQEMLSDEALDNDEKILKKMELIVNQYKARVEGKMKHDANSLSTENLTPSHPRSLSPEEEEDFLTCCLPGDDHTLSTRRSSSPSLSSSGSVKSRRESPTRCNSKIPTPTWYRRD